MTRVKDLSNSNYVWLGTSLDKKAQKPGGEKCHQAGGGKYPHPGNSLQLDQNMITRNFNRIVWFYLGLSNLLIIDPGLGLARTLQLPPAVG